MVFTDEPIAGLPDGSDEILRTQQGVDLDITLVSGQTFIRFAPNGALADAGLDDEFKGLATRPTQPFVLRTLVANLLPINSAQASSSSDDDSSDDGSGGSSGQSGGGSGSSGSGGSGGLTQQGGANPVTYSIEVCPKTPGYKGRAVAVLASGQIRVSELACSS